MSSNLLTNSEDMWLYTIPPDQHVDRAHEGCHALSDFNRAKSCHVYMARTHSLFLHACLC